VAVEMMLDVADSSFALVWRPSWMVVRFRAGGHNYTCGCAADNPALRPLGRMVGNLSKCHLILQFVLE
jgi:hypothetical protein